jgi:hypothetical protein
VVESHLDWTAVGEGHDLAQNIRDLFKWLTRVEAFVSPSLGTAFVTERQKEAVVREGIEVGTSRLAGMEDRVR